MKTLLCIFLFLTYMGTAGHLSAAAPIEDNVNNRDSQVDRAGNYFYQGDFDNALRMYKDIVNIYPDNSAFRLILAKVYMEKADFQNARRELLKIIGINPNNTEARYYLAQIFLLLGDNKKTIAECVKTLEIDPEFYLARLLLADAYTSEFDDKKAEIELKKLLVVTPDAVSLRWRISQVYGGLRGDVEKGIAEMEKTVQSAPGVSRMLSELGGLYLRVFNFEKAIENFKKALEINPQNLESNYGLGQAYQYADRLDDAARHYRIVLEKQPQNLWLLQNMATVYYKKGEYDQLWNICLKGIELHPDSADLHFMLALAYYYSRNGRESVEKAKEQMDITLRLNAHYPNIKEWLKIISALLKDNGDIAGILTNVTRTSRYIIRTDASDTVVMHRLVQEGKADQIFEDARAFFSKLLKKEIIMPPITVSIFGKQEYFNRFYRHGRESSGSSISVLNEIIIDGSQPLLIEHLLLHETAHAILSKNVPNIPEWLGEALSGGLLFSTFWGIDGKYVVRLAASSAFDALDAKTIMSEKQEQGVYNLFGIFLLTHYYPQLQEYIRILREHNHNNETAFSAAFQDKESSLGVEFKKFINDRAHRVKVIYNFVDFRQRNISYSLGHDNLEPEDILLNMLTAPPVFKVAHVLLMENGVTAEKFESFVKKGNRPYYGNFSHEAERLLLLAAKKLEDKFKLTVDIDEFLQVVLEDNANAAASQLKIMGVDTADLYRRLIEMLKRVDNGEMRFFSCIPKETAPGGSISIFYRLLPDDQNMGVFLAGCKLGNLFSLHAPGAVYGKSGLESCNFIIPDTITQGPYKLEIKSNGEIIQTLPFIVTAALSNDGI